MPDLEAAGDAKGNEKGRKDSSCFSAIALKGESKPSSSSTRTRGELGGIKIEEDV